MSRRKRQLTSEDVHKALQSGAVYLRRNGVMYDIQSYTDNGTCMLRGDYESFIEVTFDELAEDNVDFYKL